MFSSPFRVYYLYSLFCVFIVLDLNGFLPYSYFLFLQLLFSSFSKLTCPRCSSRHPAIPIFIITYYPFLFILLYFLTCFLHSPYYYISVNYIYKYIRYSLFMVFLLYTLPVSYDHFNYLISSCTMIFFLDSSNLPAIFFL